MSFELALSKKHEVQDEKVYGFEKAYFILEKKIDDILNKQKTALISLAGKSASGKTFFSEELKKKLTKKDNSVAIISTDDFYNESENLKDKDLNLEELQNKIKKLKEEHNIILVEGFQVKDNDTLSQKPDFKVFIDLDSEDRLALKIERDSKSFRTLKESLDLVVEAFVYSPEIAKKFEGNIDKSDFDLEVINTYKNLNNPELYIRNNELIFSSSNKTEKRSINDKEVEILKKAGIKFFNNELLNQNKESNEYLKDYLNLKQEDIKRVEVFKTKDLPGNYQKQLKFFNDKRLDNINIAIIPDDLWLKGSQPTESDALNNIILMKESYFRKVDKPDEIAWLTHELSHCQVFLELKSEKQYQDNMQKFAFLDLNTKYSYPNNLVEKETFTKQFQFLKDNGKNREEILKAISFYYNNEDLAFFNKILDSIYNS